MTSWPSSGVRASTAETQQVDADLAAFVERHYPRLIRLAGLICRNARDAEDAVQAGLEKAWRGRSSLRDAERIKPWLDRIVVREAIRMGRGPSLLRRFLSQPREIAPDGEDVRDTRSTDVDLRADLRSAFAALPAAQRAVVGLHLYAGYTVAETADVVGIPIETARSRLRLARQRLRDGIREAAR